MPDFLQRSYQKELLDENNIPFKDIERNMEELAFINKYLGGHAITLKGVMQLLTQHQSNNLYIAEIGCGGGDNLRAINTWCKHKQINAKFMGIDHNKDCIAYAEKNCKGLPVKFISSDYRSVNFESKPDIIFSSLFCHHFTDEELVKQINWMSENSLQGFFINDLHRHPVAYYSIKWLTKLFSKSYLVKNDAPLSVMRGFRREEIQALVNQSSHKTVNIKWQWAFRWLIVGKH
ncbi:MAG TPA: methyltransferase domain-containing protein [Chitinophagaceae bacterium]|nr:methyltransferase domain-containing protein [Chitinophagaceae bacterium]